MTTLRRSAIAVCATLAAITLYLDWRAERARVHRPIEVFDLMQRARSIAETAPPEDDSLTDTYYIGPGGSVHLHIFGRGTTCHLHIHEHTEEAAIPVWGSARVTHRYGVDGEQRVIVSERREGTLVVSPPNCAHEWVNLSNAERHASLVFTLGEAFPGNLFVGPNDRRILRGAPPSAFDAIAQLDGFVHSDERVREVVVPVSLAAISEVLVKDDYRVAPDEHDVVFIEVVSGTGRIEGAPDAIALKPNLLVVVRSAPTMRIVADRSDALAFFLVRIPKKES